MTQVLKNKKGVTLVELLAVIVIMGIIAAIAVPAIGGLIKNSERKAAETEYANLLDAARLYAQSENPTEAFTIAQVVAADYMTTTDAAAFNSSGAPVTNVFNADGSLATDVAYITINDLDVYKTDGKVS